MERQSEYLVDEIKQSLVELESLCDEGRSDSSELVERVRSGYELVLNPANFVSFNLDRGCSFAPVHGRCPYRCEYCYQHLEYRTESDEHYHLTPADYQGPLRLNEDAFLSDLDEDRFIIVGMGNDLWAGPAKWINRTLDFLKEFPKNRYDFITKNPARYDQFLDKIPSGSMLSCTIETDAYLTPISKAPSPAMRAEAFKSLDWPCKQLVLMPMLPFNALRFFDMILEVNPQYLSFNAFDARSWVPDPSFKQILKICEFCKMLVKYTAIKLVGDPWQGQRLNKIQGQWSGV